MLFVDQANIDTLELYQKSVSNKWEMSLYGNNLKFDERKYKTTHFIMDLESTHNEKVIYIRLKNNVQTSYNLMLGENTAVLNYEQNGNVLFAIILGVFAVMITYNLFLYVIIRETVYLVYVIQSFFTGLLQTVLFGFSYHYFWPNKIVFQEYGIEFLTTVATIFGLYFMNTFLKVKFNAPKLYMVSKIFIVIYSILGIIVLFDITLVNAILLVLHPLLTLFILFVAIAVMAGGYKPARFYLLSWSVFLIGILIFVLAEVGVLERNNFTTLTMTFGAGLETVLLSFALANRINILKSEQEDAISTSYRLEKEKATLIQEQNLILEEKVSRRTTQLSQINIELEGKNTEIEDAYSNLKETQSQLVNAEKMSSLGQLTAGIAHEINNPINFVSSNVAPLKRDVDDLLSIIENTDTILKEDTSPEVYAKVQNLKEEIDFAYVIEEIDQLLDGMKDGANRTVEIIKGLKLFSRIDEDDLKKVNLEEGIKATLVLLNSHLKHTIKVTTDFEKIPLVECYGGKLNQVFMNVLSNGIQAINSTGREDGEIIIATKNEDAHVVISIKDNGIGITDEVKKKLFEPFFTTKPVGEGTGLGLSIVFTIIEKINGSIIVNSAVGEGTEFIIRLPIINTNHQTT
ncbi:MAG: signal transduction histidine kinase [Halieaceae bacterium]